MTNLVNTNLLPTASSNITSIITSESSSSENNLNNLHTSTTQTTNTTSGTSNSSTTNSQETCLICGDVASGKHYGLRSCEACKAFFKRTVQGKIEYSCPATKECEINKRRRKACQACRFQKCLNMGMLKEGVRLDRVRGGRQKYRQGNSPANGFNKHQASSTASSSSTTPIGAAAAVPSSLSSLTSSSTSSSSLGLNGIGSGNNANNSMHINCQQQHQKQPQYQTSTSSSKQHHNQHQTSAPTAGQSNSIADQSFENQIMTALINCEPEELISTQLISSLPSHLNLHMKTLYILSDLFDRELVSLIGWAKQIPGFSEQITLNDQMRLLQSTWAEVIALSIGYRSYLRRTYGNGCNTTATTTATPSPSSLSPASTSSYNSSSNNSSNCLQNSATTTTVTTNNNSNNNNLFEIRLAFAKDLAIDLKHAINCGAEEIFYNCAQLIKRLEYLKMKHQEYILLKAISLTNADVRLENPNATFRLRNLLMDALSDFTCGRTDFSTSSTSTPPCYNIKQEPNSSQETTNNTDSASSRATNLNERKPIVNHRLNEILLCLPILRQIDSSIRKFWNDIRKGPNNVPMNKLFEEMLEPCQRMYRSGAEM